MRICNRVIIIVIITTGTEKMQSKKHPSTSEIFNFMETWMDRVAEQPGAKEKPCELDQLEATSSGC